MLRRRILTTTLAALLFSAPAYADDSRAVAESQKSLAAGIKQYKSGDREGAAISFAQSFAAWPSGEALRRLAITELELDRPVEALKHFRMYAQDRNADADFVKTKLPAYLQQSRMRVGHLRILAAPEAIVTIDNRRVQEHGEDGVVDVLPGEHVVAIRGQDPSAARSVRVEAMRTIEVDLRPAEVRPPVAPPVAERPAVQGGTPAKADAIDAPPHTSHEATLWPPPTPTIVLAGVSAAALATGIGFGVAAHAKESDLRDASHSGACPAGDPCAELRDLASTQNRNATIANIAFGTAAAAGAGALITWYLFPREKTSRAAAFVPAVHRTGIGLSFTQTF